MYSAEIMTYYSLRGKDKKQRAENFVVLVFVKHERRDRKPRKYEINNESYGHTTLHL